MVNSPFCTCGAATVLAVGDHSSSSHCTPFMPFFLCIVCPTPLRLPESVWAASAPEYLVSNPWRSCSILPVQVDPVPVSTSSTSVYTTAQGSTPRQPIPPPPAACITAKSSPPPTYEVALADTASRAFARQKQVASTRRLVSTKPKQSTDQVRAHLFALRETSVTLATPSRSHKSLVALAVTIGVNPFGGRPVLVARLITHL